MKLPIAATMIIAGTLAASAAQAETTTAEFDVKCAMILNASSKQPTAEQSESVKAGLLYYVGRIDSRTPVIDMGKEAQRLAPSLEDSKAAAAHGAKCMQLFGTRMAALTPKQPAKGAAPAAKPAPKKKVEGR
ncbi:hypothetical protein [Sphingomonas sp. ID0503]|uniref:hypothetical protein n=1 Tax=Sphingomonas sp. ID0503 TaxID=3399691 RepID=UPI003AFB0E43